MAVIKIKANRDDLHHLRFAYSPLAELSISYRVLTRHSPVYRPPYESWLEQTQRALYGVELPYMDALMTACGYVPDFLTPTPQRMGLSLEEELDLLAEVPDSVIRKNVNLLIELSGPSEMRQNYLAYPREMLLCLIEELRFYWQRALAPHYPQMLAVLEGDVLYRARQLAVEGPAVMLADLHPSLILKERHLQIDKDIPMPDIYPGHETALQGHGLQLMPSIFSDRKLHWQFAPEWQPMLMYGVRGMGMWQQQPPDRNYSLELTLGEGRARVLQALIHPASTGELAHRLQLSAGGVSQHLSRLHEAGLVESHRSGKHVFYQLTQRGADLLAIFDRTV